MVKKKKSFASVYILDGEGGAQSIPLEDLTDITKEKKPIWVHLNLSDARTNEFLSNQTNLPSWILEYLTDLEISDPHLRIRQNNLLFALRTVKRVSRAEPDDLVFLRVYATKNILITTRLHPAIDFSELDEMFEEKDGPENISDLILTLLENTLDSVSDSLNDIENQVDKREEKIIAGNIPENTYQTLSELLRQVIIIRRFMVPERELIGMLIRHRLRWFSSDTERGLRDHFDWVRQIIEDVDLLEKRIRVNQDALAHNEEKKTQRNMYMLSVIAGIFLPLSFLSGVFGMNLNGIPLTTHPLGFWGISAFMLLVGICVWGLFKKVKWI